VVRTDRRIPAGRNTYGAYRGGDIDVERTSDIGGGWNVLEPGEVRAWAERPRER
jgi:hypothetical protein